MSGGKGGSQTTEVQIPQYLEDAVKENIARGSDVAKLGYTPYYGPDVAAMTPMQTAAAQNINQGASAFGLAAPSDPMAGMPQAQTFAGGLQGYSSGPLYDQSLAALQQNRPGQYDAMTGMFIDPQTGAYDYTPGSIGAGSMGAGKGGMTQPAPVAPPVAPIAARESASDRRVERQAKAAASKSSQDTGVFNTRQGPNLNGEAGYGAGGFTGVRDMFDGGGPGQSGDSYQGGGVISKVGNIVTGARPTPSAPVGKPAAEPAAITSTSSAPSTVGTRPKARPAPSAPAAKPAAQKTSSSSRRASSSAPKTVKTRPKARPTTSSSAKSPTVKKSSSSMGSGKGGK